MVPFILVMVIECRPFLATVSIQKGCVNIKKHEPRHFYGTDDFAQLPQDLVELLQGCSVHTVEKTGKGWLWRKDLFFQNGGHDRLISQFIRTVIFKIGGEYLVAGL